VQDVQADEMWGFIQCKEKTRKRLNKGDENGDAWAFVAMERHTKLVLTWHLGKRTGLDCWEFIDNLREATSGRFQMTTDGFRSYGEAVPLVFDFDIDFAQMIKKFYGPVAEKPAHKRYSPSAIIGIDVTKGCGNPEDHRVCTSHIERQNLTMRMSMRRLTRLTNGYSKSWEHHEAMLGLYFAWYNFARVHSTIKTSPAVASGLASRFWTIRELLNEATK